MSKRALACAGSLLLGWSVLTAISAPPALAARQRAARTTTTLAADTPASTTTTITAPTAPPTVTRSALTVVTPAAIAPDGSGTMTPSPAAVSASSTHNTIVFTYTAVGGDLVSGTVTLTVPSNWSAPSTTATNAAFTTASTGTRTISSRTITVSNVSITDGNTFTITYGDRTGGGPGVTAPSTPVNQSWVTGEKSSPGGSLLTFGASALRVAAKDGAGTLTTTTKSAVAGSTTNTINFTYTGPTGNLSGGAISITVPTGWTPPQSSNSGNPGYVLASPYTVSTSGQTLTVSGINLSAGLQLTITYGANNGATAPSTTGAQTWQAQEQSTAAGTMTNLAASPSILVASNSTMVVSPTAVSAGSLHNTMTFTYTAPSGGLNGTVTLTVPTGWSTPSVSGTQAGYTTASTGTRTISSRTITVSGLTLGGGATLTISYGDRSLLGAGATAPSTPAVQTWTTMETSTGGPLIPIGTSPSVTVTAKDGTGTLTTSTKNVSASSTGNTIMFPYTAPAGGLSGGVVTLTVPAGWSAPSTIGTEPGYTTSLLGGTVSVAGQTITVSGLTLSAGQQVTIVYGDGNLGGGGALSSATLGLQTWQAQEKSTSAPSSILKNLSTSPSITVNAGDGTGTMTITSPTPDPDPLSTHQAAVHPGATGLTMVFTFKAPAGGMVGGSVTLTVPPDWTAPSLNPTGPGYIKTSASGVGVLLSGQKITVSNVTKTSGSTFTISYGVKTSGGPGATAPVAPGFETWQAQEQSTGTGTLRNLVAPSPVTLVPTHAIDANGANGCTNTGAAGGSGTFCFTPNSATASLGGSVTFANFTNATHDIDRCTPAECQGQGPGDGGDLSFGGSPDQHPGFQYTFEFNGTAGEAGHYYYRCSIHGYAVMHGEITVS